MQHHSTEQARSARRLTGVFKGIGDTLALWHFRASSRREIQRLDARLLRDAGVDPAEAYKPFWRK